MACAKAWSAGVTPDGGTLTEVSIGASGRITVSIAKAIGGVSTNTYRDFNVPRAGVDLDNNKVLARTIVNQVTSTNPSVLEGPLSVLGRQHANVIVANPNGVTVNGLSVQNVGNLAITTGEVSFNDFIAANDQLQSNVILKTSQGVIAVGAEGFSGTLLNLELIARQIRIGGPVTNLYGDANAKVRLVAGSSYAETDTSVSPTDNLTPWIDYEAPLATPGQGLAIDLSAAGSLSSGRIALWVTDKGAGVHHAGAAYATAGDFQVTGSGDLQLASGKIEARRDILVDSGGMVGTGNLDAGRHLQVSSDRVDLARSQLSAGTKEPGDIVIGATGQVHGQPIRLADSTLDASGGIGIFDAGEGLSLTGTQAKAAGNIVIQTPGLAMEGGAQRGALVSTGGTVAVTTSGDAVVSRADIDGMAGTRIQSQNLTLREAQVRSSGAAVAMDATGTYAQHDSSVLAATDVRVHGGAVAIDSASTQSTLVATNGGVLIESDSDVTSHGALMQGQTRISGEPLSTGAVTVRAAGNVTNQSTPNYLGILFGAADDVDVQAGGNVVNRHARMLSNGRLRIHADGDVFNEITRQAGSNGEQPEFYTASGQRWLVLSRRTSGFDVDYGVADRPGQVAYLSSEKGTIISGRNVINDGGDIYAHDGPIRIVATDTFRTRGMATGTAHYERSCLIFCRTSASSTTTVTGGELSARGDIDIRAGKAAYNEGGRVLAMGDLTVTAPVSYARGITGYSALGRDRGFKAFFGDRWARLYATDLGGSWMANGRTQISGDTVTDGGSFDGNVAVSGLSTVIRARHRDPVSLESHLGLTTWFWR